MNEFACYLYLSGCRNSFFLFLKTRRQCGSVIFFLSMFCCYCFVDDEEPTFDCQNITTRTDAGLDSLSNVTIAPYVYDNVDVEPNVTCSHTFNDTFLIGNTTVTCTSTDNAGNTGSCFFIITVIGKDITRLCL